jgi:Tol biopolymer transport system component
VQLVTTRLVRVIAAVAVLLGSGLPAIAAPAHAASFPGRNGKIVFARDTGTPAVYVMNADGSNPKLLARSGSDAAAPSWSADGSKIVFVANKGRSDDIFVTDRRGKHTRQLTKNRFNEGSPTWSPNGRKIAFTRFGDNVDIYVMDANGKHLVNLTHTPGVDEDKPTWSPDGTKIAFTRQVQGPGINFAQIAVMNADGSGVHNLTTVGSNDSPNWSPDGTKLAYEATIDDQTTKIYVMNADGSHPVNVTGPTGVAFAPWWSPDGTKILFATARGASALDSQIYVMNADGSHQRALTNLDGVIDRHPSWQPIGPHPSA